MLPSNIFFINAHMIVCAKLSSRHYLLQINQFKLKVIRALIHNCVKRATNCVKIHFKFSII